MLNNNTTIMYKEYADMIKYVKAAKSNDKFEDEGVLYSITVDNGKEQVSFDYSSEDTDIQGLADMLENYCYNVNF